MFNPKSADETNPSSWTLRRDHQPAVSAVGAARDYLSAFADRNLDNCLTFFGDDAVIVLVKRFVGRQAIADWHRQRFSAEVRILNVNGINANGDVVTVDAVITSKRVRGMKIRGQAVLRFADGKIHEMGFRM